MEKETVFESSLGQQRAFAVQYPGYVNNPDRAVKCLGGLDGLTHTRSAASFTQGGPSPPSLLELHFRPSDPLSHPIYGECESTPANLLLRVRRRKRKAPEIESEEASDLKATPSRDNGEDQLEVKVVAQVGCKYKFTGLADFQYTPLHNFQQTMQISRELRRSSNSQEAADEDDILRAENASHGFGSKEGDLDTTLLVVPPLFCKTDIPQTYSYRVSGIMTGTSADGVVPNSSSSSLPLTATATSTPPPPPSRLVVEVEYKVEVVPAPLPALPTDRRPDYQKALNILKNLFYTRAIWSVPALLAALPPHLHTRARSFLPSIAYRFVSGPWRKLWVLRGVDPRKNPSFRSLQIIDYRLPQHWFLERRTEKITPHNRKRIRRERQRQRKAAESTTEYYQAFAAVHLFQKLPTRRCAHFQIVDLQDPDIQAITKSGEVMSECCEGTGWFRRRVMNRLVDIIRHRFQNLIENPESAGQFSETNANAAIPDEETQPLIHAPPQLLSNPSQIEVNPPQKEREASEKEVDGSEGMDLAFLDKVASQIDETLSGPGIIRRDPSDVSQEPSEPQAVSQDKALEWLDDVASQVDQNRS